jgi:hypothetical protein
LALCWLNAVSFFLPPTSTAMVMILLLAVMVRFFRLGLEKKMAVITAIFAFRRFGYVLLPESEC